jgi:hypothetical protein
MSTLLPVAKGLKYHKQLVMGGVMDDDVLARKFLCGRKSPSVLQCVPMHSLPPYVLSIPVR